MPIKTKKSYKEPVGELRPSALLHTFGVGAMIDLPHISAMIMGLDEWLSSQSDPIHEPRLLEKVRSQLGPQVEQLLAPPRAVEELISGPMNGSKPAGVPVAPFPRWLLCPSCRMLSPIEDELFTLKRDMYRAERTHYEHTGCTRARKTPTALPARFLVACENGHLDEFPWNFFVHRGKPCSAPSLRLYEMGSTGEAYDVYIKCEGSGCAAQRPMGEAFGKEGRTALPMCRARHPHLRDFDDQACDKQVRPILLGASNMWFGVTLRTLHVPEAQDELGALVDKLWHFFEDETDKSVLRVLRKVKEMSPLQPYSDDEVWAAVERKRNSAGSGASSTIIDDILVPEWRALSSPPKSEGTDDFRLTEVDPPPAYTPQIGRVVLVERLRAVQTLIGFTRIDSPSNFADPGEIPEVQRAPLSRNKPKWVPAVEVRGEGIFIQFDELALESWLQRSEVQEADEKFHTAHARWRKSHGIPYPWANYPGLRYVLLHTFAHALMRQLSLECGYSMASLTERIYAREADAPHGPMAGVLISTAASDSEGTLGGLVSLGQPQTLERHIKAALAHMELCASDPHCAEHGVAMEDGSLHGACCHACLFAPESSCERNNRYLDRAVLVPTVERSDLAFFGTPA